MGVEEAASRLVRTYSGGMRRRLDIASSMAAEKEATLALAGLSGAGIGLAEYAFGHATLDQVFLALTGHPADGSRAETEEAA